MMVTLFRSVAMEYKCQSELSYNKGVSYKVDYAIVPHGADEDDLIWENALCFNTPMAETDVSGDSGWSVDGAYLSAMRKTEVGVFLRIYSGTDRAKTAKIAVPAGYTKYAFTDGLMNPGKWCGIDGEVEVVLKPFEVRGIIFA